MIKNPSLILINEEYLLAADVITRGSDCFLSGKKG